MAFVQSQGKAPHPNPLSRGRAKTPCADTVAVEETQGARYKQRDAEPGYDDPTAPAPLV